MAGAVAERVIDRGTLLDNDKQGVARLLAAGYLGPFGVPFACGNCDFFDRGSGQGPLGVAAGPIGILEDGRCGHPRIRARVAPDGCCDLFERNGVSNPGSKG